MADIRDEIAAFKTMQARLEAEHLGKWVLIHQQRLVGLFISFDAAATEAVARFGNGPFLIRLVGEKPMALPASVAYARPHA
jgi:hypothetical protein